MTQSIEGRTAVERRLTAAIAAEFTDAEWEAVDRVSDVLDANPGEWWTPSRIARKAKTDTNTAWHALRYLSAHRYCRRTDRGALSKFAGRD